MSENKTICAVCAWRATCRKQFSLRAGQKCPEFVKDVAIKEEQAKDQAEGGGSGQKPAS
jgi:hypothetical protein